MRRRFAPGLGQLCDLGKRTRCYSEGVREEAESSNAGTTRVPYVWDYDIDETRFRALLGGREATGRLDRDWAAARLLDHASWCEIRRLMSLGDLGRGASARIKGQTMALAATIDVRTLVPHADWRQEAQGNRRLCR